MSKLRATRRTARAEMFPRVAAQAAGRLPISRAAGLLYFSVMQIGDWVDVAPLAALRLSGMLEVEAHGHALLLIDMHGTIHATAAVCPHHQAWLSMGRVDGDCIDCPRHQGRFHIPTGEQRGGPPSPPLRVYPVRICAGRVEVWLG